jgi:hypothetical protein
MNRNIAILAATVGVTLTWACSDDHEHKDGPGGHTVSAASCQAIIDACHPLDTGGGPIHDCHELAHVDTATEQSCAAKKAECLVTCAPSGDGGADAGP